MKAYSKNPWLVENIDDFNFWCCPECAYKSKDRTGNLISVVEFQNMLVKKNKIFGQKSTKLRKRNDFCQFLIYFHEWKSFEEGICYIFFPC